MTIVGLAESVKTMNRPDRAARLTLFDGFILGIYLRYGRGIFVQSWFKYSISIQVSCKYNFWRRKYNFWRIKPQTNNVNFFISLADE